MIRSARANLLLLISRNYLLAGLAATAMLAFVAVMFNVSEAEATIEERGPLGESITLDQLESIDGLGVVLGSTITMVGIALLAVGANAVGAEYSAGVVRNLLVRQPNRLRLLAGKTLALAIAILAVTVAVVVVTVIAALAFAPDGIDTAPWVSRAGLRALAAATANYYLAALGWALLGQVLATLTRSSVISLTLGVMVAIPVDMVLTDTIESTRQWLPGQLFQTVARGGTRHLEYDTSIAVLAAGGAAAITIAMAVFHYRDITS